MAERMMSLLCSLKMPQDKFKHLSGVSGVFSEQSLEFQEKIMERSGLGDETYLPPGTVIFRKAD
jgi:3-ketoacyl-CoA synthase